VQAGGAGGVEPACLLVDERADGRGMVGGQNVPHRRDLSGDWWRAAHASPAESAGSAGVDPEPAAWVPGWRLFLPVSRMTRPLLQPMIRPGPRWSSQVWAGLPR